jgi:alpha-beta hydrolase superfamily lysophospholipase
MIQTSPYTLLDRPEILGFLFHPRRESYSTPPETGRDLLIPVEPDVSIGARFYPSAQNHPTILFFHGNGEIVADYDDIASQYNRHGINFFPVDYRGYGRSGGTPTVSAMMKDCRAIFDFAINWLAGEGYMGPLAVMGRSLGSASALELASSCQDRIDALIIESGFAHAAPLLRLLGIPVDALGMDEEEDVFRHVEKIRGFKKPVLIIHAENDHIISFEDGKDLYEASGSNMKRFLKIADADHNTIFYYGMDEYMLEVRSLLARL